MHPGPLGPPAALPALWANTPPRHYSASYIAILAVIAGVGYLTIRRRRDRQSRSPGDYRPPAGQNEFELHPSPEPAPRPAARGPGPARPGTGPDAPPTAGGPGPAAPPDTPDPTWGGPGAPSGRDAERRSGPTPEPGDRGR